MADPDSLGVMGDASIRRFRPTDRRSPTKVGRNGCPLGAGCYCCPLTVEKWHRNPASNRTCDREHPPADRMCRLPYPKPIPACPERATLPEPPPPPAGCRPYRYEVCVDCGRITPYRWTDPQTGQVLAWCAGLLPSPDTF